MTSYQPMAMNLETERLTMRSWAETDADDYCALVAERDDGVLTVEAARERVANLLAASAETGIALLPICRRVEGDFIGYCGLIIGRATVEEPEIAYELFRRVHGRGYATEAARAVLDAQSVQVLGTREPSMDGHALRGDVLRTDPGNEGAARDVLGGPAELLSVIAGGEHVGRIVCARSPITMDREDRIDVSRRWPP